MLENLRQTHLLCPYFFTGMFFVLGAIVGSFLNVCILRIPRGESVATPGSHCACGRPIPLWNNIPILSWFILRGKASCCGRKFSIRYAAIEALTGLLFAAAWHYFPWQEALALMVFCAFGIVLAFIDWDTMYLPDCVNAPFVASGLALSFFLPEMHGEVPAQLQGDMLVAGLHYGLVPALIGLAVGGSLSYWMRYFASVIMRREAMGEGDVILLGGIGAFFGWKGAVFAFFASSFLGLGATLFQKIFGKEVPADLRATEASRLSLEGDEEAADMFASIGSRPFPLGPWLLLGALIYCICGEAFYARVFPFLAK